jgi:hypothetical protein
MPRDIAMDPNIWTDPEFAVLSTDEKLAWFAFISEAEDSNLAATSPKLDPMLALSLLQKMVQKGLIQVPAPAPVP